jgi:hypothetical protein
MANKKPRRAVILQPRDYDLFELLYRTGSATADQVFRASSVFALRFASLDRVQRRLRLLSDAGWVRRFEYQTVKGIERAGYFKLTLKGYREWLDDHQAQPPTKRFFEPIAAGKYRHDYHLTDVIIKTLRGARRCGLSITNFRPQGTAAIYVDDEPLLPDAMFELVNQAGRRFPQCIEIDGSSERRSLLGIDRWATKNLRYDRWADWLVEEGKPLPQVLVFSWKSRQRFQNILARFGQETRDPNRILYKGCLVADYLDSGDPIGDPLFADHRRRGVPMIVPTLLSCGNASLDQVETPSQVEYHSALLGKPTAVGMGAL